MTSLVPKLPNEQPPSGGGPIIPKPIEGGGSGGPFQPGPMPTPPAQVTTPAIGSTPTYDYNQMTQPTYPGWEGVQDSAGNYLDSEGNVIDPVYSNINVQDIMGTQVVNPLMAPQSVLTPTQQQVNQNEMVDPATGQITAPTVTASTQGTVAQVDDATKTGAGTYGAAGATAQTIDKAATGEVTDTVTGQTGFARQGTAATGSLEPVDAMALLQAATKGMMYIGGEGPSWNPQLGKFTQGGMETPYREFTPEELAKEYNVDINQFKKPSQIIDPMTGRAVDQKELATAATADRGFLGQYDPAQSAYQSDMDAATMEVTDEMTVQGQLTELSKQFDDGKVPGWAAGVIRNANQQMAARGLSASSMAGAAVTQAALEAALPIATRDAATYWETAKAVMNNQQQANLTNTQNNLQIELTNLSNRQQVGLAKMQVEASLTGQELSNQQQVNILNANKFSEAANMTFTQEQNRVFANSKMIETLNLQNLSNNQAMALANAATLANMDMANLSNRQQAEIQNAQNFLAMDMANLTNEQQTKVVNQAAQQQAMMSTQAANNAAMQFNATSQNQTDQFFANLQNNINTTNAASENASAQFNAGQLNAMEQFQAGVKSQTDQFNSNNAMVIAQSNVQWRRNVNTANTAAQNAANQINAQNYFNLSNTALSNIWQEYRDEASFVYQSSQNNLDRAFNYSMAVLEAETTTDMFDKDMAHKNATKLGGFLVSLIAALAENPQETEEGGG